MKEELREAVHHGTKAYPFALYRVRKPKRGMNTPPHWHEEAEIVYVESGTLHLTIGEEAYLGTAGDLFMINTGDIHSMFFDSLDTRYLTMLFPLSSLTFQNVDDSRSFLMSLHEQQTGFVHVLTGTPVYDSVREDIRKLLLLNGERPYAYQLGTKVCLLDIVHQLFAAGLTIPTAKKPEDAMCRDILSYLRENFAGEVSLTETASRFHMSEKYFSRFFKKNFSLTFVEYVNQLRIEKAEDLLANSSLPITEIALRCGFSSSSYFNKRFKTLMGITPSAYRGRPEGRK